MEKRKKLQLQASSFLLQLTKCLSTCKKEVYTLSPNFVKPNVSKLREAVDNALYVAERIKRISISSTVSLKQLTQSAATVARLVHIPDSMHSTATKSSYHCLLRIRRFLNLSIRVAAVLHAFTEKITKSKSRVKIKMTLSDFAREKDGHNMEVAEQSKLPKAETVTIPTSSSAHWKASSKVPFFLKPATLNVFDSSSHKEMLLNSLKKKLECLPAVQSRDVQMVKPSAGPGKECDFDKTCKDLHNTLISDQKPVVELVVSVPLHKISSSNCVDKKRLTASMLPDLYCPPPAKRRASNACCQFILDDVVDVGVIQGSKESMAAQTTNCNPGAGNDFLWQVKHVEVVEKERSGVMASPSVLKNVKKHSTFKSSCKKRFSPYHAGRPSSAKTSPCKNGQKKCVVSKALSLTCEPQRNTLSVASSQSERMKPPLNKASIKLLKSYHGPSFASVSKPVEPAAHQSTQQQIQKQPMLSMDELADLVERKCYPITIMESLSKRYSQLSFKDPRQYELTSSVIPRERYPGLILQDGGVRFVLRASPLTPVLFQRIMEGRNMNILPKNLLSGPQIGGATSSATTGIHKSEQSNPQSEMAKAASPFSSPPVCKMQSFNSVVRNTIDGVVKKPVARAPLKPTRRRLHPTLSNELAVRKNPRLEACPASDREEYREILGTKIEMNPIGGREEQPRKARLGKVRLSCITI